MSRERGRKAEEKGGGGVTGNKTKRGGGEERGLAAASESADEEDKEKEERMNSIMKRHEIEGERMRLQEKIEKKKRSKTRKMLLNEDEKEGREKVARNSRYTKETVLAVFSS